MSRRLLVAALLSALPLAACSAGGPPPASPSTRASRSIDAGGQGSASPAPGGATSSSPVSNARPIREIRDIPDTVGSDLVGVQGVRADGSALVSVSAPPEGDAPGRQRLGVIDPAGTFTPFGATDGVEAYVAASKGPVSVFLSTSSTSLDVADWQIRVGAPNRLSLLGDSTKLVQGRTPPPPEYQPLATDGRTVYWSSPQFLRQSTQPQIAGIGFRSDILAAPADGSSRPSVLVRGAALPASDGDGLWYVRQPVMAPELAGTLPQVRHRTPAGVDEEVVLGKDAHDVIGALCVSTTRLAWTTWHQGFDTVHVRDRATGRDRDVTSRISPHSTYLGCGDRFVAFGGGSGNDDDGEYVLVGDSDMPVLLGRAKGAAIVNAAGPFVSWRVPTEGPRPAVKVGRVVVK